MSSANATRSPVRGELASLWTLAWPAILTQVGQMMLGVVDTAMLGHYSTQAMAASQLGHNYMMSLSIFSMGVLLGIDPIVSQAHGAGDRRRIGEAVQRGFVLCGLMAVLLIAAGFFARPALIALRQDPELAARAQDYVTALLPGIPCFLAFGVLRSWLQGREITRPMVWITIAANFVNAGGNWVLIYGKFGLPELGVVGAGISTSVTRLFMLLALVLWIRAERLGGGTWMPWSRAALQWRGLRELLSYGMPTGLQIGLEIWAFSLATFLAGKLGATALASHGIVLNMSSLSFMFPLGVAIATSTRVGNLIGANNRPGAQRAAWVGLALGAGIMSAWALVFVLGRHVLPRIYADPGAADDVLALCALILPLAAAFQIFDGTQAVGSGVLRGMGRTRPAAIFNLLAYFGLALPIAWWLGIERGQGLFGVWVGLALGLAAAAAMYVLFIWRAGPARPD